MVFDVLIVGGGVSGLQCALVLGSAKNKQFAADKSIGIIAHQRASHLQNALFNNVLGLQPGTLGKTILEHGKAQLSTQYAHITQIDTEKVTSLSLIDGVYNVLTNKNTYRAKLVVIAQNYGKPFTISGLEDYIIPHQRANPDKNRIQLQHTNFLVKKGLYCCGTIAGLRSQFAIAAGSGATVATDILTLWNNGKHTKVHDKI